MGLIPNHKYGICHCGECPVDQEVPGRKPGKIFMCLRTYNAMKSKEQVDKSKQKNQVRMLSVSNSGTAYKPADDKLIDNEAAKKFRQLMELKQWFIDRRLELTGTCQCGCNQPSQNEDDKYYRNCCCHIFAKAYYPSVKTHPMNFVERRFWGGCHSNMDDRSMDKWPSFADWPDIKNKFYIIAPLLTDKEKGRKDFTQFEKLVTEN